MPKQLEKKLVEDYVIEKLQEIGWRYVEAKDLERASLDEPLLLDDLKQKILEINQNVEFTEDDINEIIRMLQNASTNQNGHRDILNYFKYGVPIKTEKEKISRKILLFDFQNPQNNEFIFTNQFDFFGRENIRLDLILFVNGIPLVNIESKNPYTRKTDYRDAFLQIKRYEKVSPELYKYIQIGIGFAEKVKYFPIIPWLEEDKIDQFVWRWEGKEDDEAIFVMLEPKNLLDILKNFIFIREVRGEIKKVVPRYMQFRAANKIYQRVIDNLNGETNKNKGLIWHWQGSGKTLTMIFSAYKLYYEKRLENPTIFFIVDRRDLEEQLNSELSSLDLGFEFERIESIKNLKEVITWDNYKGKRGVFLTLIHKFDTEEEFILNELENVEGINIRKNVICFLDEVHRTQYGELAGKMHAILKNGFFFGFTGTPIMSKDRNTYEKFGYISEGEMYLDKYFIDDAQKDGFVVPIVYEMRKEEVRLKDQDLEWYFEKVDAEDIADEVETKMLREEIRRRINEITVFLENEKNIEIICEDIAQHFKENFDGKFKGLIVTGSRKACVIFKEILDKYLPSEYSEVVMTFNPSDPREPQEIQTYREKLIKRFNIQDTDEIIKIIIEKFRKEENPKLLIVTDMLITGFDEPQLGVLYLYKLLKDHRLLQAIARVNRPYIEKECGLVVDYVGIFKDLKRALEVYSEDEKLVEGVVIDKDAPFEKFVEILKELRNLLGDFIGKFEKESFDGALEIIKNPETGKEFEELYKKLRRLFEFLKSDERVIKYLSDYKWVTALYEGYKKLMKPDLDESKIEKFFNNTIAIIRELIEVDPLLKIRKPLLIDLQYIKSLKENLDLSEKERTIGIINAIDLLVRTIGDKNPIYKSIADRVRELVEKWQEDEINLEELGIEVDKIVSYIEEKEEEHKRTGLNEIEFGIKLILENKIKAPSDELENWAKQIYKNIKSQLFEKWNKNPAVVKEVEKIIRETLIEMRGKYKFSYEEFNNLHKEIFDYICKNA
ncbi:type I restriction endonuclease subunit R [Candidatus Kryptobacter tengchongensis]|uniref:Type I restriction enzyme endonuclease subunit n=1 Tax=Kryptobacter tengchongensis TaxID=1643429 RepID=A0A916LIE5_KRYT1|nr:HsdR family type I site-specific deoxyribonuclease [Candidatus Kryptobacter tengchongensis]CUS96825.1 type I restriction enzyme, R subunit [Candidatus Kryptobacter tengchongensis]